MLGGGEILVVLLFVLLLFGSNKIPEAARMLGKGLREFRRATDEIKREINNEAKEITNNFNAGAKDIADDFKDIKKDIT
jgi:sec-independent protein translocase protein TatA